MHSAIFVRISTDGNICLTIFVISITQGSNCYNIIPSIDSNVFHRDYVLQKVLLEMPFRNLFRTFRYRFTCVFRKRDSSNYCEAEHSVMRKGIEQVFLVLTLFKRVVIIVVLDTMQQGDFGMGFEHRFLSCIVIEGRVKIEIASIITQVILISSM